MFGHRTALLFSGILSMLFTQSALGPEATQLFNEETKTAMAPKESVERALLHSNAPLGRFEGVVLASTDKFHPKMNLVRLDGTEIDPSAARRLFADARELGSESPAVVGCYEVVSSRLKALECMEALKGSLDPRSSRVYYVELGEELLPP